MPDFSLSFDNWMELQFSSSECIGEKAEIMKALVCNDNRLESSIGKPDEKNVDDVIEIWNYDLLFDNNQSEEVQSSSSESEDETTLKEEGPWCEQKFMFHKKSIGRDKKFKVQGEILAPLLMVPQSDETRKEYYINDSIRSRSELEVLIWFKAEKLRGVHKLGYSDANEWPFVVPLLIVGFVTKYGDCLTHGDCFPFKQADMVHFRRCIFLDIYRRRLHRKK
uniref:Uncharacterized protein n=1 Tax=Gossypium raimondii TaxID=29730 RepID=A0A0D2RDX0_GOSRA|nr:hypothetical protein B456_005G013800 [Gossypium raimondii]